MLNRIEGGLLLVFSLTAMFLIGLVLIEKQSGEITTITLVIGFSILIISSRG